MNRTVEELEQVIRTAYEVVGRIEIREPELTREAFSFALHELAGERSVVVPDQPSQSNINQSIPDDHSSYDRIASELSVPVSQIELLFDISNDELTLTIPPRSLPDSTSAAMREVAVLLAVGRRHAGIGTGAPFDLIRSECAEHGKLDKKNFAAAMTGMKPRLSIIGKGTQRELIPKRPADDWARELIAKYTQSLK